VRAEGASSFTVNLSGKKDRDAYILNLLIFYFVSPAGYWHLCTISRLFCFWWFGCFKQKQKIKRSILL